MLLPFERKKLNKILTKVTALPDAISTVKTAVDTLAANWTATRAGYLDNIRSYTATNNTASATGTLSQKQTYTNSTLIGATGATGGTASAGTLMAKSNKLLKISPMNNIVTASFSKLMSSTAGQDRTVCSLSNVILYGGWFETFYNGYSSSITINVDDTVYTETYTYNYDIEIHTDSTNKPKLSRVSSSSTFPSSIRTLDEPIYAESLSVVINTKSTYANDCYINGCIFYKQL